MDLTSKVNRLLAEFAGRIGLPSLSLDEEGMASLLFDEQVGVTLLLLAERERLLLEADVAGIDVLGEGIFRQLASFNRHWHRFDLHFGFDELTGKVQLYAQILAAQLTLECFEATLANLLDHAEFWQRLLPCDGDCEAVAAVGMRV
ncbi:glycosyl transferase [Pseudomonas aeruginosa]|uniref:type III secretion system regulatory chaperone ExsC n=1 Tax=Pseudomonas aeruginosa TaxID=287 RepID=UPI00071BBA5C|nr:type III secretion system regulatory chaperone ExsC [Pseudomonas aeruginosa]KSS32809.1 glycosyl transferase [Pseudomonas aeruginosa]MBH9024547.1 type III secretion system regulatory chaperone ExsC [Pseudomonas aeruginosa]USI80313.1 type III secretion system regulatory chaperone ExsC [Pseudomonas aeruginosa]HBP5483533.1 type III secretion system regulatory chaperone ExsC [Pseudomonas aeruginosa]